MNEQRSFLLILIAVLGILSFMMVEPLLGYFLGAIILAFVMYPLKERLDDYLGDRISAFLLVILGILVVVVPIVTIGVAVMEDASNLASDLDRSEVINTTEIEQSIEELTGREFDIESNLDSVLERFSSVTVGSVSQLVSVVAEVSIGITFMVFLLYYLLKDGERLVIWLKDIIPLPEYIVEQLHERIDRTTWAVIKGHVLVAVVQGLVAGLGLAVTGVPNYAFWTFIMIMLGFIPIIGTILVWLPASVYLFLIDREPAAVFLALYGFIIVSLTDNVLRPIAVDRGSNLHPAVIIVGVIGGVYIFGASGLFIGPIILGILKAVLLVFKNHYKDL